MTNLSKLIEQAKKEFEKEFGFDGGISARASLGTINLFLESKMKEVYEIGYKQGMIDEQECMEKSGEHHVNCKPKSS